MPVAPMKERGPMAAADDAPVDLYIAV